VVQRIEYSGLTSELQQRIQNRLTIREGDTLEKGGNSLARVQEELQQIDEHLGFVYSVFKSDDPQRPNAVLRIGLQSGGARPPSGTPVPAVVAVGAGTAPVAISRTPPEYTDEARKAKWQGSVVLQVLVDENGVPKDIKIVRALGMGLDQKAIEAVQQWRFKPMLLNGKPVPVSTNIEVNFRL
jgi:TonB family protein